MKKLYFTNFVSFLGGRAALSAIPSALKRWNEESCVIDGDSMHNCVTALKPTILEVCNFKIISLKHKAEIFNGVLTIHAHLPSDCRR